MGPCQSRRQRLLFLSSRRSDKAMRRPQPKSIRTHLLTIIVIVRAGCIREALQKLAVPVLGIVTNPFFVYFPIAICQVGISRIIRINFAELIIVLVEPVNPE